MKSTHIQQDFRIFLMFNKFSTHKKIIYDAFVKHIGANGSVDLYIYNNDPQQFTKLLESKISDYSHYVLIPHFEEGCDKVLPLYWAAIIQN